MRRTGTAPLVVLLTTLAVGTSVVPAAPARAAPTGVTGVEVSFTGSGGVALHGTVLVPAPGAGRHPGIVMLEGAGNRGRGQLMPEAEAYARHGVVTLVYDKRTVGYSLIHRDYPVLADDALAALRLLRSRPDVDPTRVGLWGLSEGAWVAPIAADRSTDVTFLITVGAVGTTVAAQTAWEYGRYLHHAGVTGSLVGTMQGTAVRSAIGAHLFPEAGYDGLPAWQRVRQPVLAEWGQFDRDALPARSSRLIAAALDRGGNQHHTIRIVPAVNHDLHVTADAGFDRLRELPAGYADYETAWLTADPARAPAPQSVPPLPEPAPPTLTRPAWYDAGWAQLAVLLILLGAFAAVPVGGALSRMRHRAHGRSPRSARWLAALGPTAVAGTVLYIMFMLASAAKITGPVLAGRPVPWLVLQLLAVATVALTATVAAAWWRRRHAEVGVPARLGPLLAGGLMFIPWAVHWGLLLP
jgi:dienelactone hydrolase